MIQAVIFDHDGTLVDSEPVHFQMWQATLADHDVDLTRDYYRQNLSGKPTIDSARQLVQAHQLAVDAEALCRSKLDRVRAHLRVAPFPLFAEVRPVLTWLQALMLPMAVASGAARHEVESSLEAHGLASIFKNVSTREDVRHNKPAPDVYLRAAAALGIGPAHCLAVEDSDSGQLAARAAGMACVRLNTFSRLAPDPGCTIVESLSELRAWLAPRLPAR